MSYSDRIRCSVGTRHLAATLVRHIKSKRRPNYDRNSSFACSNINCEIRSTESTAIEHLHHGIIGQTTRPAVLVRMLKSVPPAVIKSVFRSSPPKAQFVTSSRGTGKKLNSLPSLLRT